MKEFILVKFKKKNLITCDLKLKFKMIKMIHNMSIQNTKNNKH